MRRPFLVSCLTIFCMLFALPSAALTLLGVLPRLQARHVRLAQASSFLHLGVLGWFVALVLALAVWAVSRHRAAVVLVLPAVAGLLVQSSWIAPYYWADRPAAATALGLTVVNVEFGDTDGETLARRLAGNDVVVLLEATPETVTALSRAGMDKRFPHRIGRGLPGVGGTVLYSRLPMSDLGQGPTILESRLARVATPAGPVLVAGVHPVNPMSGPGPWVVDAAALHTWLAPHLAQDLVVAGDFNAIDRHVTMQPYWRAGLRSTADLAGAGFQRTWPTQGFGTVPLIAIDHVLVTPRLTASRHEVLRFAGTDHAGLRTTIARAR